MKVWVRSTVLAVLLTVIPSLIAEKVENESSLTPCQPLEIRCPGTAKCVPSNKFCDLKGDCRRKLDEYDCHGANPSASLHCSEEDCSLPHCFCSRSGMKIPGGLKPEETPQMVMITFDDAVHDQIDDQIVDILDDNIENPNGCSIKGTLFVSHANTDYSLVNRAHRQGHEIASHSITHIDNDAYWRYLDVETWRKEMVGQRYLLAKFANISINDIKGMRVPLLAHGGNNMFEMMREEDGFVYDSSIGAPYYGPPGHPIWPYTLDYRMPHDCRAQSSSCPSRSFPGIWEIPINTIDSLGKAYYRRDPGTGKQHLVFPKKVEHFQGCGMADSCQSAVVKPELFYDMLIKTFYRHYDGNRAPLGIFLHAATFKANPDLIHALKKFIRGIATFDDVFFLRMNDVVEWMKKPTPLGDELNNFAPWKDHCHSQNYIRERRLLNDRCVVKSCRYHVPDRTMFVCDDECPDTYPDLKWFEDFLRPPVHN